MPETIRYTIGQLAQGAGVPISTVRYYERAGLLSPVDRTNANYRVYDEQSLERLQFIRAAQRTGFALDDVRQLLDLQDEGASACRDVQQIIGSRLAEIEARLRDLRHIQRVLKRALVRCRESERQGTCSVITELKQTQKRNSQRVRKSLQ
ncbi:MAG: heavy metal-responsive transcriptional regulator [Pirellulaceae bacterium]|nr:MAG: heavy metal-responsive transcriptional regulator [Pirellulaceae bacterium]